MRCVAYCRVSTDKKEQEQSFEAQKNYWSTLFKQEGYNPAKCGMLVNKDGSIEIIQGIYADEAESATSIENRMALKQMIKDAKMKKFDVIYVKDVTRLTRNSEDISLLRDLKEVGVNIIFETEGFTLLDTDEFLLTLWINLANRFSDEQSKKVKWGIREKQKQGKSRSPYIFGYEKFNGDFKIYPQEAEIVKEIFSLYLSGKGYNAISRELTEREIPTKTGAKWRNNTINGIIENPIYAGVVRSHVRERIHVNRKTVKMVNEEEIIYAKRPDLAILSPSEYDEVLKELNKRKKQKREGSRSSHKHLLSNLIKCKNCGGGFRRKKYRYKDGSYVYHWVCIHADMYGSKFCNTRTAIREDVFINDVKSRVGELLRADLEMLFNVFLDVKYGILDDTSRIKTLEEERSRLIRKKEIYEDEYAEEIYTKDEYKEKVKALNIKLKTNRELIEALGNINITIETERKSFNQYIEYLQKLDLNSLTNVDLKRVFSCIEASTVYKDGKKIKMFKFIPRVFEIGLDELINRAVEIGYKVNVKVNL